MLVEAAGRLMIPVAIVLASCLILLIIKLAFGSIRAGVWLVLLAIRVVLFGIFIAVFWFARLISNGIRFLWFRITS